MFTFVRIAIEGYLTVADALVENIFSETNNLGLTSIRFYCKYTQGFTINTDEKPFCNFYRNEKLPAFVNMSPIITSFVPVTSCLKNSVRQRHNLQICQCCQESRVRQAASIGFHRVLLKNLWIQGIKSFFQKLIKKLWFTYTYSKFKFQKEDQIIIKNKNKYLS